jgi:hypothetical protein
MSLLLPHRQPLPQPTAACPLLLLLLPLLVTRP